MPAFDVAPPRIPSQPQLLIVERNRLDLARFGKAFECGESRLTPAGADDQRHLGDNGHLRIDCPLDGVRVELGVFLAKRNKPAWPTSQRSQELARDAVRENCHRRSVDRSRATRRILSRLPATHRAGRYASAPECAPSARAKRHDRLVRGLAHVVSQSVGELISFRMIHRPRHLTPPWVMVALSRGLVKIGIRLRRYTSTVNVASCACPSLRSTRR